MIRAARIATRTAGAVPVNSWLIPAVKPRPSFASGRSSWRSTRQAGSLASGSSTRSATSARWNGPERSSRHGGDGERRPRLDRRSTPPVRRRPRPRAYRSPRWSGRAPRTCRRPSSSRAR